MIEHADGSYTRLEAAATSDGGYDFDISDVQEGEGLVIAVKGDINLDGKLMPNEVAMIKAAQLGKLDTFTVLQNILADLNGDGKIMPNEVAMIKAAQLGKLELSW